MALDPHTTRPALTLIVHYYTDLDRDFQSVSDWLYRMTDEIGEIGGAAYREGERLQAQIGPRPRIVAKTVAIEVGERHRRADMDVFPIAWWATGASLLFPRMEGEIIVAPVGHHHTRIMFQGHYQPPLGRVGEALDRALLARIADSTVKDWIDRLCDSISQRAAMTDLRD